MAWHEVQAEWRRQARLLPGNPPESPEEVDTATIVEHRLELSALADALARLRPSDRAAALAGIDWASHEAPLSPSEKMRRYRARRRLAALMAGSDPNPPPGANRLESGPDRLSS